MYYFIVKEQSVANRPTTLLLAGYCDLAGVKYPYWHEESLLHPETERFESVDEATLRTAQVGGTLKAIPKTVYQWLLEQKRLDEEELHATVSC